MRDNLETAPGGPLAVDTRENFIPVTQQGLRDRLTRPECWTGGRHLEANKFFRYLNYWRRQQYTAHLHDLQQAYEPFSPDSDLLVTRAYSDADSKAMRARVIDDVRWLLKHANYSQVDAGQFKLLAAGSDYGLDLEVDMHAFDEIHIFYRGKSSRAGKRRSKKGFYLRTEDYHVPIFQRLCIVFKLKPFDARVREVMDQKRCDKAKAEKIVEKMRRLLPPEIKDSNIYVKLFKNIPQSDLEMVFPNTRIKFRMMDKVKLGTTAGGGIGAGVFGAAGKIALLSTNPVAAAGAAIGLGGVAFRQAMNVVNQKNKYMVTMAQNLYFHAMADNRGAMTKLADRAAEEDIKEEMLLYAVLAKERVRIDQLAEVDEAIELYLRRTYEREIDFDVSEALGRLLADGIVTQAPDGTLVTLPPAEAALHIDTLWDNYLDTLPELKAHDAGVEFDDEAEASGAGS